MGAGAGAGNRTRDGKAHETTEKQASNASDVANESAGASGLTSPPKPAETASGHDSDTTVADLERAIGRTTRAIANAADDVDVADLVAERRAMGEELRRAREDAAVASGKVRRIA